jgi:uncharacterized YccA/Bax inhibitor family protein
VLANQLFSLEIGILASQAHVALISGHECTGAATAKFKVILERVENIIQQGATQQRRSAVSLGLILLIILVIALLGGSVVVAEVMATATDTAERAQSESYS